MRQENAVPHAYDRVMHPSRTPTTDGFTLLELLVVVSVIAILASLLLSGVRVVRDAALSTRCAANLRQISMGAKGYEQDWNGFLVAAQGYNYIYFWGNVAPYVEEEKTAGDARVLKRVLRGCPAWPLSAWYKANPALVDFSYTLSPGYGETVFTKNPAAGTPSPTLCTSDNLALSYGSIEVPNASITFASTRPFFADCPRWFLWTPWLTLPASKPDIDNIERHRGKGNVVYFDGHVALMRKSELDPQQIQR